MKIYGYVTKHYPNFEIEGHPNQYAFEEHRTMVVEIDGDLHYLDKELKPMREVEKVQMVWWKDQRRWDYASELTITWFLDSLTDEYPRSLSRSIDASTVDLLEIHSR